MGEMDPSGNLSAQGVSFVNESLKLKFGTQVLNNKFATYQFSGDWRAKDWTASLAIVNPNLFNESGIAVLHFLQGVTPRIALGAELMYQQSPQIPGGSATLLSGSARYTGDDKILSGYYGSNGFGLCFYQRLNEDLQVGAEIENSVQHQQTIASVGYQFDIPKANFVMKGMVDTNWTVTGLFEKRLNPMPFTFSLCGSLNHAKNQFRLGCGLTVG
jgi:mitochondrial import receptor subunit TOM40